jgi:hypothetical protein
MKWHEALLGFQPTEAKHAGAELARFFFKNIDKYDIRDRLGALTSDNASPNNTMVDELNKALGG